MEIWKDVSGYEGLYQVSNTGKIKSLEKYVNTHNGTRTQYRPTRILKMYKNDSGYLKVFLTHNYKRKEYAVHRLVASAFIENPSNKPCVNHIDNNRENNCVENLEWCTHQENSDWAKIQGRKVMTEECRQKIIATRKRKPVIGTDVDGKEYYFNKVRGVTEMGFDAGDVIKCCNGKKKYVKGFTWRYADEAYTEVEK